MTEGRGFTDASLPDLEALLQNLERERVRCPLTETNLVALGLGHLHDALGEIAKLDAATLATVLRIAIAERRLRPVPRIGLVWTGPEAHGSTARDTLVVVREIFEHARKSVLIGGYRFDHGKELFAPLHAVMKERHVETKIFLDDASGFIEKNWPFGEPFPEMYCDPRTADAASRFSLHAKCIVADERKALVTSANFTDRGQTRNLEMGVLIEDGAFASRLVQQWRGLVEAGLLVRG